MRQSKACSDVSPSRRLRIPSIPYSLVKQRAGRSRRGALQLVAEASWRGRVSTGMAPPSQAIRFRDFCLGISNLSHCFTLVLHVTRWSLSAKTGLRMMTMRFLHGSFGSHSPAIRFCLCVASASACSTPIDRAFSTIPTRTRSPSLTVPARIWLASRFCNSR